MPLRYQKRINLGKGYGINLSNSGISSSYRTKHGSIGTKGFSIRTGIPGLSYRSGWGKQGGIVLLILLLVVGGILIIYNAVRLILYTSVMVYQFIKKRIALYKNSSKV